MSGLHEAFDEIAAEVPVYGDLDRALEQAERERRRQRWGVVAGLAAAAAVVALIIGTVAAAREGDDAPQPIGPPPTPTEKHTEVARVPSNGQITSADAYLGTGLRGYAWRAFDPIAQTGLLVTGAEGDPEALQGLAVLGRTGPVATLTCARELPCSHLGSLPPYMATLGPGADEVTVGDGDRGAQVIGYDGTLRRTLDLGATTPEGGQLRGVRWSPDGSRLAVVTSQQVGGPGDADISRVWLVDPDGGEAQLAYSLRAAGGVQELQGDTSSPPGGASGFDGAGAVWSASGWGWSPDGQALLLDVLTGMDSADVVVLHLQPAGAADPVKAESLYHSDRNFDWAGNVAWSPDGTRIAVRTAEHIVEISAEDGSVVAEHRQNPGWLIWPVKDPS